MANELRAKMRQMESDMLTNERNTFDITAEMTRQYKAMQENLMGKIGNLESEIHRLKDELGAQTSHLIHVHYQSAANYQWFDVQLLPGRC